MRAEAVIEVVRRNGRDVLVRVRSEPPLSLRGSAALLHLVGSGAGPLGGDDLTLRVRVGPGASLTVASVAASMILPGPTGLVSRYRLDAEVDEGGHLSFLPEPQILVRGCDHEMHSTVRLGEGSTLVWRDETVLGRHEEVSGSLVHRVRIDREDRPVLCTEVAVGPRWPGSLGPGGIDGATAMGTVVLTQDARAPDPAHRGSAPVGSTRDGSTAAIGPGPEGSEQARAARLELADGTVVLSALGGSARGVRAALDRSARALVHGS